MSKILVAGIAGSLAGTIALVAAVSLAAVAFGVVAFGLATPLAMALYFTLWWTLLFLVLPFSARSQADTGEVTKGTDPGAPSAPPLREKAIWTTLVAAPVFVVVSWALPLAGL